MNIETDEDVVSTEGNLITMYMSGLEHPLLSPEEEVRLGTLSQKGDEVAQATLVNHNLKLVVSVATQFYHPHGLTLLDLIQEGNVGLLKASQRFDPSHGTRFSTYAVWWIRAAIIDALRKSSIVRIPSGVQRDIRLIRDAERSLMNETEGQVSDAKIASFLKLPEEVVSELRKGFLINSMDQAVLADGTDSTLHDYLKDGVGADVAETTENRDLVKKMLLLVQSAPESKITTRNKKLYLEVLKRRYGLPDYDDENSEEQVAQDPAEIAESMGISSSRVSTLLQRAHRAVRNLGRHLL